MSHPRVRICVCHALTSAPDDPDFRGLPGNAGAADAWRVVDVVGFAVAATVASGSAAGTVVEPASPGWVSSARSNGAGSSLPGGPTITSPKIAPRMIVATPAAHLFPIVTRPTERVARGPVHGSGGCSPRRRA